MTLLNMEFRIRVLTTVIIFSFIKIDLYTLNILTFLAI